MDRALRGSGFKRGFTIVELIVVIAVIAIITTVAIVSYSGWQTSIRTASVKNDLNAAATTLEDLRNTSTTGGYPTSDPPFTRSPNIELLFTSLTAKEYCLDAHSTIDPTVEYYLYSRNREGGPIAGTCLDRTDLSPPVSPASVSIVSTTGTSAVVNWSSIADAVSYIAQCASDPAFIYGPQQATVTNNTGIVSATVNNLTPSTQFYCRVKSVNTKGASAWSGANIASTNATYGGFPVATSIEGYWATAPQGYLLEDGSAVSRTTYASLFAVIGTTYGAGDGTKTFNLPDSRGRTSVNRNTSDVEFATIGQKTGSKTETLTAAQLPPHQHGIRAEYGGSGTLNSGTPGQYNQLSNGGTGYPFSYSYTQSDGGSGGSHNNIQPSIVKVSAIKFTDPDSAATTPPAGISISGYWTSIPSGYVAENGASLPRASYPDLYNAIGITYGSVDGLSFNVPNSQGRASAQLSSDTEFDTLGERNGTKVETLTVSQIPAHRHNIRAEYGVTAVNLSLAPPANYNQLTTNGAYPFQTAYTRLDGGSGQSHNNIQPSITKLYAIKSTASTGVGNLVAPGTSIASYANVDPVGYLFENGAAVSRTTYADLFTAIGTTYGAGDGTTTFNIPDSRGRIGVNISSSDSEFNTLNEKYGTKTHTLTGAQIPAHQHAIRAEFGISGGVNSAVPGQYNQLTTNGAYPFRNDYTQSDGGGGGSHNEIQPTIVKRFLIKY